MYSTRGYNDSSLNRNDLIWNASLGKYFPKAMLDVSLQACDLLHQLSNISVMVNGQGRTETWTNSLPRYVMLKLAWRFQKYPKRRNKQRDMMWF